MAVVTRSSGICSGFCPGAAPAVESSLPFHAPLPPSAVLEALCSLFSRGKKAPRVGTSSLGRTRVKQKRAADSAAKVKAENEEGHRWFERPLPWLIGEASVAATIAFRNVWAHVLVSFNLFVSAPFRVAFCFAWWPHYALLSAARASQR